MTRSLAAGLACLAVSAGCSGSGGTGNPVAGIIASPQASATPLATATPTIVASASPVPSATPVPTATPTATPTAAPGTLVLTQQTFAFDSTGTASDQTTTVSESGYSGSFSTSTTTCANIVTITGPDASGVITVEPIGAGTCSFSVSDTNGQSKSVTVTVTLTSGTVQ